MTLFHGLPSDRVRAIAQGLDGMMWFGSRSRGKVWDCVGVWYSGEWRDGYGAYVAHVKQIFHAKPWRRWAG